MTNSDNVVMIFNISLSNEPCHEKTCFLHMQKQGTDQ